MKNGTAPETNEPEVNPAWLAFFRKIRELAQTLPPEEPEPPQGSDRD